MRLYLVAPPTFDFEMIEGVAGAGVGMIQLRSKQGWVPEVADHWRAATLAAGIPLVVNDTIEGAKNCKADGVHLGQQDATKDQLEALRESGLLIGRSTHSRQQVLEAIALHGSGLIDYFAVGPVYETPTKPGRKAVGLDLVTFTAEATKNVPWFAIGGINSDTVGAVMVAGAQRVAVVRAICDADDPVEAARRLSTQLAV